MAQARTLEEQELARVLAYIEHGRHAHRNRAMLLLTHWAGLRVGEVAVLRWSDVTNSDHCPEFELLGDGASLGLGVRFGLFIKLVVDSDGQSHDGFSSSHFLQLWCHTSYCQSDSMAKATLQPTREASEISISRLNLSDFPDNKSLTLL